MGFNANKTKVQLKLAVNRLKMLQSKKASINATQRREVANLLEKGKEESARIRVEHIIREDYNMEALEMLEIYCEMLLARFGLIETMKSCDPAIAEAAQTIIYAAPRSEVQELMVVREQLVAKYGKEFGQQAMENKHGHVNERLIEKLRIGAPDPKLVSRYLTEIAHNFNVPWGDDTDEFAIDSSLIGSDSAGSGALPMMPSQQVVKPLVPMQPQMPPQPGFQPIQPVQQSMPPPFPSQAYPPPMQTAAPSNYQNMNPDMFPSVPTSSPGNDKGGDGDDDDMPDFDELTRRFEAIKRRQ